MGTTSIYTPIALKGNTYRVVKNNSLLTIEEVGPTVSNINIKYEDKLGREYIQISTAELVSGILFNRLVFAGKESDLEETEALNKTIKTNAPYGFKPGHKYIKLGARNCVIKGGENEVHQSDEQAKPNRPYKNIHICTLVHKGDRVWNTLVLHSETEEDVFVTVDEEFTDLRFTSVKNGLVFEVSSVTDQTVTCNIGSIGDNEELIAQMSRTFKMYDFIDGIETGRLKPEQAFFDMIEEQKRRLEIYNEGMELHFNYFDSEEEPKDFGTDESARASDFQWVSPKPTSKRKKNVPLRSLQERMQFKSKSMTRQQLLDWANKAFED